MPQDYWEDIKAIKWYPERDNQLYLDAKKNILVLRDGENMQIIVYARYPNNAYIFYPNEANFPVEKDYRLAVIEFYRQHGSLEKGFLTTVIKEVEQLAEQNWGKYSISLIIDFKLVRNEILKFKKEHPNVDFYFFNGVAIKPINVNPDIKLLSWRFSDTLSLFDEEYGYKGGTLYLRLKVDGLIIKESFASREISDTLNGAGIEDSFSINPFDYGIGIDIDGDREYVELDEYFAHHFSKEKANKLAQFLGIGIAYSNSFKVDSPKLAD